MTTSTDRLQLGEIQLAADRLVTAQVENRPKALEEIANLILDHFGHVRCQPDATAELFSKELPKRIQVFTAAWVVWVLNRATDAFNFDNTEAMVGALFDRTLLHRVYEAAKIDSGKQTFQKLSAVTDYIQVVSGEIEDLLREQPDLRYLHTFREDFMRLLNRPPTRILLSPLLPRALITKSSLNTLFRAVKDYIDNTDADPIYTHLDACKACDEFVIQAETYGTVTSGKILGGLGRRLKAAIEDHFKTWEEKTIPQLAIVAIAKKYPLMRPNERINFKIRITNGGNGPARELMVDELVADSCLGIQTSQMQLGTLQPGRSLVLDIEALVVAPTRESGLVAQFSWLRPRGRSQSTHEFKFLAQREDIDWDEVELTEPYSLEAVTTEDELIGRKDELKRLLRLTGLRTVGSGFIYGHKRVGKTSLANAVEERLRSQSETK